MRALELVDCMVPAGIAAYRVRGDAGAGARRLVACCGAIGDDSTWCRVSIDGGGVTRSTSGHALPAGRGASTRHPRGDE
jgi:hypothetical protein